MKDKEPETTLGTVTIREAYTSFFDGTVFSKGDVLNVGKILTSPTGKRFYKICGTINWISDNEVDSVNIANVPIRRTVKIYSA